MGNNVRKRIIINEPLRSGSGSSSDTETIALACSDETSDLTTGAAKVTFVMPFTMTITEIFASLTLAQAAGSIFTLDINKNGISIMITKLTIDNGEETSLTAVQPWTPVDIPTILLKGNEITIDIDQVGATPGKGLKVYLNGTRS